MPKSLKTTLDFFADLRANNNKAWFDANRARYEASQRAVEEFLSDLFPRFTPVLDLGATRPKDSVYRIFRDVRFSKDKTPYKTQAGMLIGNGGRKAAGTWYYLHFEPNDNSFVVAGLHEPSPEQLRVVREAIATNPARLRKILDAPDVRRLTDGLSGETLKTTPKGYAADHPAIDLLKHKEFLLSRRLSDKEILSDGLAAQVIEICAALKPFAEYFTEVAGE